MTTRRNCFPTWARLLRWPSRAAERGCVVRIGSDQAECPGYPVKVADTVGAGDAFAAAFLHGLGVGWSAAQTGDFANRLGALVASRAGAVPEWSPKELDLRVDGYGEVRRTPIG